MAQFEEAIAGVLKNEGGLSVHPEDPGGTTNFGISSRQYPTLKIEALTRGDAIEIYRKDFWEAYNFGSIVNQRVANKIFDLAVNAGPGTAIRILQRVLDVKQDGKIGPVTIARATAVDPDWLVDELKARAAVHYCQTEKPVFLLGSMRRAVKG